MLYIFGGSPDTGKSTLLATLAKELRATYLRVDVVEQAMRSAGILVIRPECYNVCYEHAKQNLRLGIIVIPTGTGNAYDCCIKNKSYLY